MEIGAGSGRWANTILELNPQTKYVIADIPPASYVAMSRLRYAYPDKKIYYVTDQANLEQYLSKPNSWDILFLLPTLLNNFPSKYFDITVAIDCLHEMNANMRHFFAKIATSKSKLYYFKIWNSTTIPLDNLHLTSSCLSDFGYTQDWVKLFSRECQFPSNFSEFLFRTS